MHGTRISSRIGRCKYGLQRIGVFIIHRPQPQLISDCDRIRRTHTVTHGQTDRHASRPLIARNRLRSDVLVREMSVFPL